ncbi:MAG: hypothetical protein AAF340_17925 [Pseudomonadota bacterium]
MNNKSFADKINDITGYKGPTDSWSARTAALVTEILTDNPTFQFDEDALDTVLKATKGRASEDYTIRITNAIEAALSRLPKRAQESYKAQLDWSTEDARRKRDREARLKLDSLREHATIDNVGELSSSFGPSGDHWHSANILEAWAKLHEDAIEMGFEISSPQALRFAQNAFVIGFLCRDEAYVKVHGRSIIAASKAVANSKANQKKASKGGARKRERQIAQCLASYKQTLSDLGENHARLIGKEKKIMAAMVKKLALENAPDLMLSKKATEDEPGKPLSDDWFEGFISEFNTNYGFETLLTEALG